MKKKLISLVAGLSIAFGLTTSVISKDYESERVAQYKQFYKEYNDQDYKIKILGTRTSIKNKETITEDIIEIMYGNNLYDNTRGKYSILFNAYFPKTVDEKNGESHNISWYFSSLNEMLERNEEVPLEKIDDKKLPQAVKDALTLPKDLQKEITCIAHYPVDNDSWIMFYPGTEKETVKKVYELLKSLDEARDSKQEGVEGKLQPIIPTENQLLPLDPFFPSVRYIDEDKDGKLDYVVELYCTNGSWFNSKAEIKYIDLTQWFEIDQNSETGMARKYDKPFKITIDFDIGKEYEKEGFDISFYDENHDGNFEKYKLIEKK